MKIAYNNEVDPVPEQNLMSDEIARTYVPKASLIKVEHAFGYATPLEMADQILREKRLSSARQFFVKAHTNILEKKYDSPENFLKGILCLYPDRLAPIDEGVVAYNFDQLIGREINQEIIESLREFVVTACQKSIRRNGIERPMSEMDTIVFNPIDLSA